MIGAYYSLYRVRTVSDRGTLLTAEGLYPARGVGPSTGSNRAILLTIMGSLFPVLGILLTLLGPIGFHRNPVYPAHGVGPSTVSNRAILLTVQANAALRLTRR